MKKIFALTAIIAALTVSGCAKDFLETTPTDKVTGDLIFETSESALTAVNGIYRILHYGGWGGSWDPENGGLPAYILTFDLYAEDHVMDDSGSGWFFYDYIYDTWSDYTKKAGHSYNVWNFFYTIICNANYIIAAENTMSGDEATKKYVIGQAYALRGMSYWWLANAFCFNGGKAGSEMRQKPGVPVYTEPTVAGAEGKGRGTIQETYDQIDKDLDKAIEYLEAYGGTQQHISHIDKYVAYGFKARACMTERDYEGALTYAEKAMGGTQTIADFTGGAPSINDASAANVLWAVKIQKDQSIYSIFEHMDADSKATYSAARHLIANWLYDQIPEGDGRLDWWTAPLPEEEWGDPGTENGSKRSWCNKKLKYIDAAAETGDHIFMRVEEMYLIAAEAACHQENYTEARNYIKAVGEKRVAGYEDRLAKFSDSKDYGETTSKPVTLMEEILLQRRIELWSEFPRIFDLQRLDLGFDRAWTDSNHTEDLSGVNTNAGSPNFILHLPDSEFDANKAISREKDQNPDFE